jgi:hypothetical protein
MNQFYDKTGGRKFFAVMLTMVLTTVLVWFDKIDAGSFSMIWTGVVLGFMGTNAYEAVQTQTKDAER